jgi:hypothetical protein
MPNEPPTRTLAQNARHDIGKLYNAAMRWQYHYRMASNPPLQVKPQLLTPEREEEIRNYVETFKDTGFAKDYSILLSEIHRLRLIAKVPV